MDCGKIGNRLGFARVILKKSQTIDSRRNEWSMASLGRFGHIDVTSTDGRIVRLKVN